MKNIDLVTVHATRRVFIVVVESNATRLKARMSALQSEISEIIGQRGGTVGPTLEGGLSIDSGTWIAGVTFDSIERIRGTRPTMVWICDTSDPEVTRAIVDLAPDAQIVLGG